LRSAALGRAALGCAALGCAAAVQIDRRRGDAGAFEQAYPRCRQRYDQTEAQSGGHTTTGRPVRHEPRDISSQPISSQPISSGFADVPSWNRRVGRASSSRDRRCSPAEARDRLCRSSPTNWRNSTVPEGREADVDALCHKAGRRHKHKLKVQTRTLVLGAQTAPQTVAGAESRPGEAGPPARLKGRGQRVAISG